MSVSQSTLKDIQKPDIKSTTVTPMMRQYLEIKGQNTDAILFYRLGDFYEMFYEDAVEASRLLDLTLTRRNKASDEPIPLCGVPYHAAEGYIAKLIKFGKKVVVCEQTEDPKKAKGLVKREVTRVVTPGIVLEDASLSARANNYLLCFIQNESAAYQCAVCDVSTGSLEYFSATSFEQIQDEIARLQIKEVFYPEDLREMSELKSFEQDYPGLYHHPVSDLYSDEDYATDLILKQYGVATLEALDISEKSTEAQALGLLLGYLKENKLLTGDLLQQPVRRQNDRHLLLDEATVRNLELFRTLRDDHQQGTLLWHLDCCETTMGSRKLAEFIRAPLLDVSLIEERLEAVEELLNRDQGAGIREQLKEISDLERLANKFVVRTANAREAVSLKESLLKLPALNTLLNSCQSSLFKKLTGQIHDFSSLVKRVENTVVEEPSLSIKDGGVIRSGFNKELDELREIESSGKGFIAKMENSERQRTGISSLKIRFNNVFGYYIEVTNTHKDKVPADYVRKQTLTNAERYITDELKKYESKVLGASERIKTLEYDIFCELRDEIQKSCVLIKETAAAIAILDVMQSFAALASKHRYVRPTISNSSVLNLKGARHPILERMNPGENFVPNDLNLDNAQNSLMIITGPNMAGKSTIMRMTALIAIMAQMGCYVPCDVAEVGLCDRVFTRVGAQDHLQKGLSTFMVEMVETAKILREATGKSLILLDEIGRGTSTFDGLSIAWAVSEDIHDRLGARTLFATHYHELCDLAEQRQGIQNFHMSVKEWNGEIIFLRKLKPGGTNRSYGVIVASMSGLPTHTIKRAKEILKLLEVKDLSFQLDLDKQDTGQMSLFDGKDSELVKKIKEVDVNEMTPMEALQFLSEIKKDL